MIKIIKKWKLNNNKLINKLLLILLNKFKNQLIQIFIFKVIINNKLKVINYNKINQI